MTDFRLKDKSLVPTKGWRALQPETGHVVKGGTREALAAKVREYRVANNLPIPNNFERMLGTQICGAMEEGERARRCRFLEADDAKNPANLRAWKTGKQDLKNFALAVKETLAAHASGQQVHVPKEEAERRASICAKCVENVPIALCFGCNELGALYREITSRTETSVDPLLFSCSICGCANRTQVHIADNLLASISGQQGLTAESFPSWCWKRTILEP